MDLFVWYFSIIEDSLGLASDKNQSFDIHLD